MGFVVKICDFGKCLFQRWYSGIEAEFKQYSNYFLTCISGQGFAVFPNFRLGILVFAIF